LLLFPDNSIELILLLATYVAHNAPLPLGLARWGSQGETLLLTVFCGKRPPSKTSVVGRELEPWTLPSAPRNIFLKISYFIDCPSLSVKTMNTTFR
jgi:hypothetical protein